MQVAASTIYKDIGFYIFATVITIVFGVIGKIYWWSATIFLLIYISLVVFTIVEDKIKAKKEAANDDEAPKIPEKKQSQTAKWS